MTWRAYFIQPVTGLVGAEVKLLQDAGSGTLPLGELEEASVTVAKSELKRIRREWWEPWQGGMALTYESAFWPEFPVLAGPIIDDPQESIDSATFEVRGLGALFENRTVLLNDYGTSEAEQKKLRKSVIKLRNLSLGGIMRKIIHYATHHKPNGQLPIVYDDIPTEGSRQRTYDGWNLANNQAWKRLQETSAVINGPDFAFRPEWENEEKTRIRWRFQHGTEEDTSLPQVWTPVLDSTSRKSPVISVDHSSDSSAMAHRVYATGAGEGAGTLTAMAEDIPKDHLMPLLESVVSDNSEEGDAGEANLSELAQGVLKSSRRIQQFTVSLRGNTVQAPFGRWNVGHAARLVLKDWLNIEDGEYVRRIIAVKFDLGSDTFTIELQEDQDA